MCYILSTPFLRPIKCSCVLLGFPVNNRVDDSLDIVFAASQSGETSVSVNQPFHKYAMAPADLECSEQTDSASDVDQLDDSGYHRNSVKLVRDGLNNWHGLL